MKRIVLLLLLLIPMLSEAFDKAPALPAGKTDWLDQEPISWSQLHGKVVILNVWTFG